MFCDDTLPDTSYPVSWTCVVASKCETVDVDQFVETTYKRNSFNSTGTYNVMKIYKDIAW